MLYRRVSTSEQGSSGLGLAAQLRDCELYLASQPGAKVLGDFVEVTSGAKSERPQLKAALALCRQTGAQLLVAKLDRLSQVVSEVALLMEDKTVDFVVARFPQASRFELHLYAALDEQERQFISQRTNRLGRSQNPWGQARWGQEAPQRPQRRAGQAFGARGRSHRSFYTASKGAGGEPAAGHAHPQRLWAQDPAGVEWHLSRVAEVCYWLKGRGGRQSGQAKSVFYAETE